METSSDIPMNGEQTPKGVVEKMFRTDVKVRIALAVHPVTKETAVVIPYRDFAEAFSYDEVAILRLIQRSNWLKRYSTTVIMTAVDGKMRAQLCLTEEATLGLLMKLSPNMCKSREVAEHIEARQEEMAIMLRKAYAEMRVAAGPSREEMARFRMIREKIILYGWAARIPEGELRDAAFDELELITGRKFTRAAKALPADTRDAGTA